MRFPFRKMMYFLFAGSGRRVFNGFMYSEQVWAALFGQYFVTRACGADKAGIVSAIGYANIIFSVFIGMALGDAFPDWMSALGMACIISSGILISLFKRKKAEN